MNEGDLILTVFFKILYFLVAKNNNSFRNLRISDLVTEEDDEECCLISFSVSRYILLFNYSGRFYVVTLHEHLLNKFWANVIKMNIKM